MSKILFRITLFFIALTGFGQMPVFKRYYIADIPGLGWLDQFYVTFFTHYVGAVVLLVLIGFIAADWLLTLRNRYRLTPSGYVRGVMLAVILITGILLAVKNLSGYYFPPSWIIVLDLTHLSFVMLFLTASLYAVIFKRKWIITV